MSVQTLSNPHSEQLAEAELSAPPDRYSEVLTPEAIAFVEMLSRKFAPRIESLLEKRRQHRTEWIQGRNPDFNPLTAHIREGSWRIGDIPGDLRRRVVEITGPVDRKMIINALNSGADTFMADFEDANSPTWKNVVEGQLNLRDVVCGTISYTEPNSGKHYTLRSKVATLIVRPRGLHLPEAHMTVEGKAVPGSLFDAGLYLFHNARELIESGSGPYFYLPKLESAEEAALWNDIFVEAQYELSIPLGTIKATVLIETLPAVFEMDEILFALKDHIVGLNCGRWDYIFSFIKTMQYDSSAILPDRSQVTMTQHCMRSYTQLLIRTCHKRGAFAIGGMAAQIPVKNNPDANSAAMERVRSDKLREVIDGHDGTWVAHPALVPVAREVFEQHMIGDNQLDRSRRDVQVAQSDLLQVPTGTRTEEGLRLNVRVGIQYLEAWLRGYGAVPLYNLMEDAATAEISRAQVWQWLHYRIRLEDGQTVTRELIDRIINEELDGLTGGRFAEASALFLQMVTSQELPDFLTVTAYPLLDSMIPQITV